MSNKVTPGPWSWSLATHNGVQSVEIYHRREVDVDRGQLIATLEVPCEAMLPNVIANAKLICAVHAMREALEYCYDHIRDAFQNGVDISDLFGDMEWRMREALEKGNPDE